ncbi:MAG TPA: trypsin-like peptidase domain-containing protein [Cellulomonas sp.]
MDQHEQPDRTGQAAQPESAQTAGTPAVVPATIMVGEPWPAPRRSRRRTAIALLASGVLAGGLVVGGALITTGLPGSSDGTGLAAAPGTFGQSGSDGSSSSDGSSGSSGSTGGYGSGGSSGSSGTESSGTTTLDTTDATTEQQQGVVLINTVLGYQSAEAAGTGLVLTSDGLIVTNNHVIEGATEITVTIGTTGDTYTATVVGTDSTADIAVLQLQDASGLTTVSLDDDTDAVAVGDTVTAIGNAEGGGVLVAAAGSVTAVDQSITTSSSGVSEGESLTGLIEVAADVVSGDSGGALLDDEGEVIGITTAASSGSTDITGYAIPIEDALEVVTQIVSGDDTDTITLGYPAFLGIELATTSSSESSGLGSSESGSTLPGGSTGDGSSSGSAGGSTGTSTTSGATVGGVIEDTPAAEAGLVAGDVITAVDGTTVASGDALREVLADYAPGDQVTLTWTTTDGSTQTATVTLIQGPAD